MSFFGMGGGAASPGNFTTGGGAGLYYFSSFTFTNGSGEGKFGNSLPQFLSAYDTSTYTWLTNTNFYTSPQPGFQLWTVPEDGDYTIQVKGASGGSVSYPGYPNTSFYARGGGGATITGTFTLTSGDKILIAVGQHGTPYSDNTSGGGAGGGGGTFVLTENASANSDIYIIAGGGGGASYWPGRMNPDIDRNGQSSPGDTTAGSRAQPQSLSPLNAYGQIAPSPSLGGGDRTFGGTNGYGGGGGVGGGGGGYFGPGGGGNGSTSQDGRNGHGYTVTASITPTDYRLAGGDSQYSPGQGDGGFGGGGGSQVTTGYGGGAGGYSGGGAGTFANSRQQNGGYGGSYVSSSATNVVRTAGSALPTTSQGIDGSVVITKV